MNEEWLKQYDEYEERKMKLPAKGGGDFKAVPAGNYVAICNAVVDLGLQKGRGMYPEPKHEIYLRFELPTESIEYEKDGQKVTGPMSIGRRFTASMSEKANLRKFIESWFGKKFPTNDAAADFDLEQLLGRKCLLNVTHNESNGKTYANLSNATPIPKGMPTEYSQHNPSLSFDLANFDDDVYKLLPQWLREVIDGRLDDEPDKNPARPPEDFDDDIPF